MFFYFEILLWFSKNVLTTFCVAFLSFFRYPVHLSVNDWKEPDIVEHAKSQALTGSVRVSKLSPGKSYDLLRFDGYDTIPKDGNFQQGAYVSRRTFVAVGDTYEWVDDKTIDSSSSTYYYCVATIDSDTTALPTPNPAQARYQDTDFVALIHFNMGTFAHNGDPCCDKTNWDVKAPYATGKVRYFEFT